MKKFTALFFLISILHMPIFADDAVKTQFGIVSVSDENIIFVNEKPIKANIEVNNRLSIDANIDFKDGVAVLINNIGGGGCPALYRWLFLTKTETKITPEFGNCSDLAKPIVKGNILLITLPKIGTAKKSVYEYNGSTITENGKIIK